jgi:hypothetical protein
MTLMNLSEFVLSVSYCCQLQWPVASGPKDRVLSLERNSI